MKILCPTDFTRHSDQAAVAADAIASRCGAALEFVHVRESVSQHFHTSDEVTLALTMARGASVRLEERANRFAKEGSSPTWKLLSPNKDESLVSAIVRHATESAADLIVISTHGKSGSRLWPMGSLAAAIVASAPVPVLVVHSSLPFVSWQYEGDPPLEIFVGLDLTDESSQVLKAIEKFRLDSETKITAGYAQQLHSFIGDPLLIDVQTFPEEEKHLKHRLEYLLHRHLKNVKIKASVKSGFYSPAHYLVEMAKEKKADIVVIGTHQKDSLSRLLEGSVSRGVLKNCKTNLLCIPIHPASRKAPDIIPIHTPKPLEKASPILCATDFSERSSEAALAAQALALRFGTEFEIAHVVEDYHVWPGLEEDTIKTIHAGVISRLMEFVDPLTKRGLSPKQSILHPVDHESVAERLIKHLDETRPVMAVISTHGKSEGPWWSIGSTANRIVHESPVPTLIIRKGKVFKRWLETKEKLHILGAIDSEEQIGEVLEWMKHFNDSGSCTLSLAHIDKFHAYYYVPPGTDSKEHNPDDDTLAYQESRMLAQARNVLGNDAEIHVFAKHNWDGIAEELLRVAKEEKIDMMILATRQWHGISRWLSRSITDNLIKHSEMNLLCLPMRSQIMPDDKDITSISHEP